MALNEIDYQRMFYGLPSPYMILDTALSFVDMNARYLEVTERRREDLVGRYVFDAFPESDPRRTLFLDAFQRTLAGETVRIERQPFSIRRPPDQGGGTREAFWTCHHIPIRDTEGHVTGMLQQADDVTSEVTAERMRDVIAHEFDHRVKNILASVSSIARLTAMSSASTPAFLEHFQQRIRSMAETHESLSAHGWTSADLRALLETQIAPYETQSDKIGFAGPAVAVSGRQAQALGMAFHELATNAAKHGAFSKPSGRLSVRWDVRDEACTISWCEDGLDDVAKPQKQGFGSIILDRLLPHELGASVDRQFTPHGVTCTISFPLNAV